MTTLVCPLCRSALHPESHVCAQGHAFEQRDGVLVLLTAQFATHLAAFAQAFAADRALHRYPTLPQSAYAHLPFGDAVRNDPEWLARQIDLSLILSLLPLRKRLRILDVGAWNGWLSHQLAKRGHEVTAVSYFADAQDGLGARQFYPSPCWRAIQMDECDLDLIRDAFDVVVLNRCMQFAPRPLAHIQAAQARVAKSGLLIATGLSFFKDPSKQTQRMQQRTAAFEKQHGLSLFLRPTRGYLDRADREQFAALGLRPRTPPAYWLHNLKARLNPTTPTLAYAVWENRL